LPPRPTTTRSMAPATAASTAPRLVLSDFCVVAWSTG
jgi:hypothetical protein